MGNAEPPEIEKLLSILNFWKRHYYTAQEQRAFNEKLAEAEGLTTRLRELMPGIFEYRAAQADAGDPFSKTWAGSAERLLIALDYPGSTDGRPKVLDCFHREDLPTHVKDWRWLIDVLPVDYENAMRPANLSKTFGRSKGGPLARFLEAILPAVTGESRTAVAIGTQLRKSK